MYINYVSDNFVKKFDKKIQFHKFQLRQNRN